MCAGEMFQILWLLLMDCTGVEPKRLRKVRSPGFCLGSTVLFGLCKCKCESNPYSKVKRDLIAILEGNEGKILLVYSFIKNLFKKLFQYK